VAAVGRKEIACRQRSLGDHVVVAFEAVDVEPRRRERIDCLRSGLDGPVEPAGFEAALDGLPGGVRIVNRQKKSKPSKESPGFVCLNGAAGAREGRGGGLAACASVVLGRAGGGGVSSSNRSTFFAGRLGGRVGWLDVDETRCEEDRSNFAFLD
jgi:hypothetical protein